jgi:hypothetical protein
MDFAICLDQFSTNFDVNNLSSNGFSIYTDLDYNNPIASAIPYQDLFAPPIGNCPLIVNVPQGATQILVIDACATLPTNIAPIFNAGNSANSLITQCCYAIIPVPVEPISWCDTADLSFDVFSASFVGQIIAGNLISALGTVTDYTIGWYKDGDYSAPEFISGYGNTFVPYQLTHPLAGNTAPYVTAGDWEGIIHDIAINGTTYSSVSGSANGTPIPFESCFGTIVVAPLQCDNGTFPLPYTHQKEFTAAGNGATPPVIGVTYQLDSSTNYFAYRFDGYQIWDELEIKFISGDPNNTGNPSLYSQPIYLEKARIGTANNINNIGTLSQINNNTYPKQIQQLGHKRILTLTNISRSANPSLPDVLDIKITPNPTNNQTSWKLWTQCLDTFDCSDCLDPYPPIKISEIDIDRLSYCCGIQSFTPKFSGSCDASPMPWNDKLLTIAPTSYAIGYTVGTSQIANQFPPYNVNYSPSGYTYAFPVSSSQNCNLSTSGANTLSCTLATPNSSIGYHKSITTVNGQTQGIISMSFNSYTDYDFYRDKIEEREAALTSLIGPIIYDPTNINYYAWYRLNIPTANIPCGDGVNFNTYYIHRTVYPNITYVEDPANNYWSITIPQISIQNQYPQSNCSNCWSSINSWLNFNFNNSVTAYSLDVVNNFGSKNNNAFSAIWFYLMTPSSINPSYVNDSTFNRKMPIYSFKTLPFVSSSAGWVNLPTLEAVPCPTLISSSMPYLITSGGPSSGAYYTGTELQFIWHFPNILDDPDWFRIYTNVTSSNGLQIVSNQYANPPQSGIQPHLIYEYSASIGTVYSSSYFNDGAPILTIDPWPNC